MRVLKNLPGRGTLLNTFLVALGSAIGLALGARVPPELLSVVLSGLGLVTIGIGLQKFLQTRNVLIIAVAVALGGLMGKLLGIDVGLAFIAEWARAQLGGAGRFNEGLIAASVLFCVGPMTLLGCIQDGVERKIELLALKSMMDGIASLFLAAAMGVGVLVSALVVLVVQGLLTLFARSLQGLARDEALLTETSAAGGPIMIAIGLGLADIKKLGAENFLPALVLAPILVALVRRFQRLRGQQEVHV